MTDEQRHNQDKTELAKELLRLYLLLKQSGWKGKVRLPFWLLADRYVMRFFNIEDVEEKQDVKAMGRDVIDLGERSN